MEIIEEEEQLGRVGKAQHIRFSRRDTLVNDLKNSTIQGLISLIFAVFALILLFMTVYESYKMAGEAGYLVGIVPLISVAFSIAGIILGIAGLRNRRKIRHYMEVRGIVLSCLVILAVAALFTYGLRGLL